MEHLRDSVRHVLAAVLMLGTLAGTVWTFSDGALTLAGAWERIISVGGIAAALEAGVIYAGWYLGQLDQRIQTARKREARDDMTALKRRVSRWFYITAGISAIANLIFRAQQLGNLPLAAFVSLAPLVLVILFMIVLRPLPVDYQDIGTRATGRALTRVVEHAERNTLRIMARMSRKGALPDAEARQLSFSLSILGMYARADEQHALNHALQLAAPPVVEGTAEEWIRTEDIMTLYDISRRSAQAYMARVPGRRRLPNSNGWEAPRSEVLAVHGDPRSARRRTLESAEPAQSGAIEPQGAVVYAQSSAQQPPVQRA